MSNTEKKNSRDKYIFLNKKRFYSHNLVLFVYIETMADRLQKIYLYLSGTAALIGGLAVTRSYLSGDKYMGAEEMYGKTVIVTGANSGVGKETARELAKRGWILIFIVILNTDDWG